MRFIKHLCLAAGLTTSSLGVADELNLEFLRPSNALIQSQENQVLPEWLKGRGNTFTDTELSPFTIRPSILPSNSKSTQSPERRTSVFVSLSLGDAVLKHLLTEAAEDPTRQLVFRGAEKGTTLTALVRRLSPLMRGLTPMPRIIIDPRLFRQYAISVTPSLVMTEKGRIVLKVTGVTDPDWLASQLAMGHRGDLGKLGDTVDVSETDLLDEIQTAVQKLDVIALKKGAKDRYVQQLPAISLPVAERASTRTVDLAVTAPYAIRAPNGQMLVKAGQRINPLDRMPFGMCLKIFDATNTPMIRQITRLACQQPGLQVIYLATRIDKSKGLSGLSALEETLHHPVYLLPSDLKQRFAIERIPALIEQQAKVLQIHEYPVEASP